jgi:hypothetical protein
MFSRSEQNKAHVGERKQGAGIVGQARRLAKEAYRQAKRLPYNRCHSI